MSGDLRQEPGNSALMNAALWVLQILLALAFLAHGWMFLFPPAGVVEQMNARKMAEVLANMDVKAAERLTLALAAKSREPSFPAASQELPKIEGKPQSAPQG